MRKFIFGFVVVALVVSAALALPSLSPAKAHESREVGNFFLVVGWRVEPAFELQRNGPELYVYEKAADGTRSTTGVEGGDFTVEIKYADKTMSVKMRADFANKSHYIADLIPSLPGDYTFHITGKIKDQDVDQVFTSADGKFGSVKPESDVEFPEIAKSRFELQAEIDALKADIQTLKDEIAALKK